MKPFIVSMLFAWSLPVLAVPGHAGQDAWFADLTLEDAAALVDTFFAGKTRVKDDGTVIHSGHPVRVGDVYETSAHIIRPDGTEVTIESRFFEENGRIVIEEAGERFLMGKKPVSGNYLSVPEMPGDTGFISQECTLRRGLSVCRQKFREDDGSLRMVMVREVP